MVEMSSAHAPKHPSQFAFTVGRLPQVPSHAYRFGNWRTPGLHPVSGSISGHRVGTLQIRAKRGDHAVAQTLLSYLDGGSPADTEPAAYPGRAGVVLAGFVAQRHLPIIGHLTMTVLVAMFILGVSAVLKT